MANAFLCVFKIPFLVFKFVTCDKFQATAKRVEFEKGNIEFLGKSAKKRKNCVNESVKNILTKLY